MMDEALAVALIGWTHHPEADHFVMVTLENVIAETRWHTFYEEIWKDKRNNDFWRLTWSRGKTEWQDEGPEDIHFVKVIPVERKVISYVPEAELKKGETQYVFTN